MTKMASQFSEEAIVDRSQNFRWEPEEFDQCVRDNQDYFTNLNMFKDKVVEFSGSSEAKNMSGSELIFDVLAKICLWCGKPIHYQDFFGAVNLLNEKTYVAYVFSILFKFLNTSKRIKEKSLRKFVHSNHPLEFDNINSPNYLNMCLEEAESNRLRQVLHRASLNYRTHLNNKQRQPLSKYFEHELSFFLDLDYGCEEGSISEVVKDTFKRLGNLSSRICAKDNKDEYEEQLKVFSKKFVSKLMKIKYENYLELIKAELFHICENKEYYGLDIYRLEMTSKPYILTSESKVLSKCQSDEERQYILMRFVILKDIFFPKVYQSLAQLSFDEMMVCAMNFEGSRQTVNILGCLILDELVEKGIFGSDWEGLFCTILNEMAESVFYKPSELDFTVTTESQKNFMDLVASSTLLYIKSELLNLWNQERENDDKH